MDSSTEYCPVENNDKIVQNISTRCINTAVIGFYDIEADTINHNISLQKIISQLKQTATHDTVFREWEKGIVVVSISKFEIAQDKTMQGLDLWLRKHKNSYKDTYINIGYDRSVMKKSSNMKNSIMMARHRMYKSLIESMPNKYLNAERLKDFVNIFKHILDNIVEDGQIHPNSGSYEVSNYIDYLLNEYHKKDIDFNT